MVEMTIQDFTIPSVDGRHIGLVFRHGASEWTHSLHSHGRAPLASYDAALDDFYATKAALPRGVHRQIFGE